MGFQNFCSPIFVIIPLVIVVVLKLGNERYFNRLSPFDYTAAYRR